MTTLPKLDPTNENEPLVKRETKYDGCGCAGGAVVTQKGEAVSQGRRIQKTHYDTLGRAFKVEVLDWDGAVYSTVVSTYNARGQVTSSKHHQGGTSGAFQETIRTYDGHGRLKTSKEPIQDNPTTYHYNPDDTLQSTVDARGVTMAILYNNRHQVREISYTPVGEIPATTAESFEYDAAGNRTRMTDGSGRVDYVYNTLSQMTSESRRFTGLPDNIYTITYDYNLSGQLKFVIDPENARVDYTYDMAGRLLQVTASGYQTHNGSAVTQFVSNISYRVWGALNDVDYSNGVQSHTDYNSRLQPVRSELRNVRTMTQNSVTVAWSYSYFNDGRLHFASDSDDNRFDRLYSYDHLGRMKGAYTGREARGLPPNTPEFDPYKREYQYDVWGNMTSVTGRAWRGSQSFQTTYTNDHREGWIYDTAGNLTEELAYLHIYDAANRKVAVKSWDTVGGHPGGPPQMPAVELEQTYDAEGQPARRMTVEREDHLPVGQPPRVIGIPINTYVVRSTVLGGVPLLDVLVDGNYRSKQYVYANGQRLATQLTSLDGQKDVSWHHPNAGTNSWAETSALRDFGRQEMDPLGAEVGSSDPYTFTSSPTYQDVHAESPYHEGSDIFNISAGCSLNGMPMSCSELRELIEAGQVGVRVFRNGRPEVREIEDLGLGLVRVPTVEGTVLGDEPFDIIVGRIHALPQEPVRWIPMPIKDANELKALMEKALSYGDCENKVKALLAQAAKNAMGQNEPFTTDVREVLNKVIADGGLQLDWMPGEQPKMPGEPISGGSGASVIETLLSAPTPRGDRTVIGYRRYTAIKVRGVYSNESPKQRELTLARMAWHYGVTGIHEMLHLIGSTSTNAYGEKEYNRAARQLGAGSFDDYLNRHCIPLQYRPNPKTK